MLRIVAACSSMFECLSQHFEGILRKPWLGWLRVGRPPVWPPGALQADSADWALYSVPRECLLMGSPGVHFNHDLPQRKGVLVWVMSTFACLFFLVGGGGVWFSLFDHISLIPVLAVALDVRALTFPIPS